MEHKIKHIAPFKTAITLAITAFLLSYPGIGVMYVLSLFAPPTHTAPFPWVILITLPIVVSVLTLIFVAVGAGVYNMLARFGLCITLRIEPGKPLNTDAPTSGTPVS